VVQLAGCGLRCCVGVPKLVLAFCLCVHGGGVGCNAGPCACTSPHIGGWRTALFHTRLPAHGSVLRMCRRRCKKLNHELRRQCGGRQAIRG
jgi:hypothetical protein